MHDVVLIGPAWSFDQVPKVPLGITAGLAGLQHMLDTVGLQYHKLSASCDADANALRQSILLAGAGKDTPTKPLNDATWWEQMRSVVKF